MTITTKSFTIGVLLITAFIATAFWAKHPAAARRDLLGLSIGMDKGAAQERLQNIAELQKIERGDQQVWNLKDDPRFSSVAIGFDRENRTRYVTAFVDRNDAKELIPFTSVGDLAQAKTEIMQPHFRYMWDVQATAGHEAYTVNVYGDNPEFVTIYSIVKRPEPGAPVDEDDRD